QFNKATKALEVRLLGEKLELLDNAGLNNLTLEDIARRQLRRDSDSIGGGRFLTSAEAKFLARQQELHDNLSANAADITKREREVIAAEKDALERAVAAKGKINVINGEIELLRKGSGSNFSKFGTNPGPWERAATGVPGSRTNWERGDLLVKRAG